MDAFHIGKKIVLSLQIEGYKAYFAGGWARDYCMDHPSDDIDIATDCPVEKIIDMFPKTVLVGLAFGIVIVQVEGHAFEVATFRRDVSYSDGRKPDRIEKATPEEDALRRDFTINGIFYDPVTEEIFDYVGGLEDIKRQVIKAIGNPFERFQEDRLRMIRAVRFSTRFNFHIDPDTEEAIKEYSYSLLPSVKPERVYQELKKMADYPHFGNSLYELHRLGLLPVIFPVLKNLHLNDLKLKLKKMPETGDLIHKLWVLFHDLPIDEQIETIDFLKTSAKDKEWVLELDKTKNFLESSQSDPEYVKFYASPFASSHLDFLGENHTERKERLKPHIERAKEKKTILTSEALFKLGIPAGKTMGFLLKKGEELAIEKNLETADEIIEWLKKDPSWPLIS